MDFSLGEDRQMLADSLRRFLGNKFSWSARGQAIASPEGWLPAHWSAFAELGAIGALFEEKDGGYGGSAFDVGVVFGELGRALAVGPFLATLMAGRILAAVGESEIVQGVVAGETLLSVALDEPNRVQARPADGNWALTGHKSLVPFAASADLIVLTAQTNDGPGLFLLNRNAEGAGLTSYPLVDGGAAGELALEHAPAIQIANASGTSRVVEATEALALIALSWEAVAIMDMMKQQTLDYLRTRKQFGVPIGKFQALQHRMANVALEIEMARSAAINAAAAFAGERVARERAVSAAKYTIGRVGLLVAEESIQMHGGIGMTWELPLSHYAKRLVMIGHLLGDEDHHLERFIQLGARARRRLSRRGASPRSQ